MNKTIEIYKLVHEERTCLNHIHIPNTTTHSLMNPFNQFHLLFIARQIDNTFVQVTNNAPKSASKKYQINQGRLLQLQ